MRPVSPPPAQRAQHREATAVEQHDKGVQLGVLQVFRLVIVSEVQWLRVLCCSQAQRVRLVPGFQRCNDFSEARVCF